MNKKAEEILNSISSEEKEKLYKLLRTDHVAEDIFAEVADIIRISADELPEIPEVYDIARRYVYDGDYDNDLPYWENIDNLISDYVSEHKESVLKKVIDDSKGLVIVFSTDNNNHEHIWVVNEDCYEESVSSGFIDDSCGIVFVKKEDVKNYIMNLSMECDSEDPMLVDLAEYYATIDTDFGIAGEIFTDEEREMFQKKAYDHRYDCIKEWGLESLCYAGNVGMNPNIRYSDIKKVMEIANKRENFLLCLEAYKCGKEG